MGMVFVMQCWNIPCYFSDDIFHGLDIESEMDRIKSRRSQQQLGWDQYQEELSRLLSVPYSLPHFHDSFACDNTSNNEIMLGEIPL